MKIQYLGHACFRLITQMGTTVVCDPYDGEMVGGAMPKVSCDVATISHRHRDHDFVEGLKGTFAILEKEVHLAADDIAIESLHSFHDDQQGKLRGENFVFCFAAEGLRIVHLGDMGELNKDVAEKISHCDVLMIPVGGKYTVDAQGAKWWIENVQPAICLPMHYRTETFDVAPLENFLKLFDKENINFAHSETLVLEDVPQNEKTRIVVLDKYED